MAIQELIQRIEEALNKQWWSEQEQDLCNGCKYFEQSWKLLVETLPYLKTIDKK